MAGNVLIGQADHAAGQCHRTVSEENQEERRFIQPLSEWKFKPEHTAGSITTSSRRQAKPPYLYFSSTYSRSQLQAQLKRRAEVAGARPVCPHTSVNFTIPLCRDWFKSQQQ
jgi:hypothetical protein